MKEKEGVRKRIQKFWSHCSSSFGFGGGKSQTKKKRVKDMFFKVESQKRCHVAVKNISGQLKILVFG